VSEGGSSGLVGSSSRTLSLLYSLLQRIDYRSRALSTLLARCSASSERSTSLVPRGSRAPLPADEKLVDESALRVCRAREKQRRERKTVSVRWAKAGDRKHGQGQPRIARGKTPPSSRSDTRTHAARPTQSTATAPTSPPTSATPPASAQSPRLPQRAERAPDCALLLLTPGVAAAALPVAVETDEMSAGELGGRGGRRREERVSGARACAARSRGAHDASRRRRGEEGREGRFEERRERGRADAQLPTPTIWPLLVTCGIGVAGVVANHVTIAPFWVYVAVPGRASAAARGARRRRGEEEGGGRTRRDGAPGRGAARGGRDDCAHGPHDQARESVGARPARSHDKDEEGRDAPCAGWPRLFGSVVVSAAAAAVVVGSVVVAVVSVAVAVAAASVAVSSASGVAVVRVERIVVSSATPAASVTTETTTVLPLFTRGHAGRASVRVRGGEGCGAARRARRRARCGAAEGCGGGARFAPLDRHCGAVRVRAAQAPPCAPVRPPRRRSIVRRPSRRRPGSAAPAHHRPQSEGEEGERTGRRAGGCPERVRGRTRGPRGRRGGGGWGQAWRVRGEGGRRWWWVRWAGCGD